jgi:hypothetical protein
VTDVSSEGAGSGTVEAAAPKRRATRSTGATASLTTTAAGTADVEAGPSDAPARAPRATRARKAVATEGPNDASSVDGAEAAAPKRRATRKKADPSA